MECIGHRKLSIWGEKTEQSRSHACSPLHPPALVLAVYVIVSHRGTLELQLNQDHLRRRFFVFMEVLFMLGYKPQLHKRLQNVRPHMTSVPQLQIVPADHVTTSPHSASARRS